MPQNPLAGVVDKQGAMYVAQRHGAQYAAALKGALFMGENPSGVTTSASLATTYVGLCLSNPAGSGKNLSLISVAGLLKVVPAAYTEYSLAVGYASGGITVHTTPLTPLSALVGTGPAAVAKLDSACTLVGTPARAMALGVTPTDTAVLSFSRNLDGSVILPPGAWAAIVSSVAGPTSGFMGSFLWEEEPA